MEYLNKIYRFLFFPPPVGDVAGTIHDPFRKEGVVVLPEFVGRLGEFNEALRTNGYSIMYTILTFYRSTILMRFIPELVLFLLRLLRPYLIYRMMKDYQDLETSSIFIILLTIICMINEMVIAYVEENHWFGVYFFKREVESTLSYAVYMKTLKIHDISSAKDQVVNLLSQDCNNVSMPLDFIYLLPSSALRFATSFVYLYFLLGWSSVITVVVILVLLPVNFYMISKSYKNYKKRQALTDDRIALINECVGNIRFIKSFYWEPVYEKKLQDIRNKEVKQRKIGSVIWQVVELLWFTSSFFMSCFTFVFFAVVAGGSLTPAVCFTAMTITSSITHPIFQFANSLNNWGKATASLKRLQKFLLLSEVNSEDDNPSNLSSSEEEQDVIQLLEEMGEEDITEERYRKKKDMGDTLISFENASFSWDVLKRDGEEKSSPKPPILKNLTCKINQGEFIAIAGNVASGKSSFANALLGEMNLCGGKVRKNFDACVAYCPQEHWVLSKTLRNNILLGKELKNSQMKRVLSATDLSKDIEDFPMGDKTKIGESGVTISGGQKARISIARCCYHKKDCEIMIFDDSLKDLDVHVGNHVFEEVFLKELRKKTRILITHHVQFLPKVDRIFVFEDGQITQIGNFEELKGLEEKAKIWSEEAVEDTKDNEKKKGISTPADLSTPVTPFLSDFCSETQTAGLPTPLPIQSGFDFKLLWKSFLAIYPKTFFFVIGLVFLRSCIEKYQDYFIASWSGDHEMKVHSIGYYAGVYLLLGLMLAAVVYISLLVYSFYVLNIAQVVHDRLLKKVLKTNVAFFDKTPSGQILSRFTKDLEQIDDQIKWQLREFLFVGGRLISSLIFVYYFVPLYAFLNIPIFYLLFLVGKRYMKTFISIARHDSAASISPILSHANETLGGLVPIRSFKKSSHFIKEMERKLETREIFKKADQAAGIWVCQRGRILTLVNMFSFCFYAIIRRGSLDLAYYGMIFSLLFKIDFDISWMIMLVPRIQKSLCSLERIANYQRDLEEEMYEGENPGSDFPSKGEIEFRKVNFKYDTVFDENDQSFKKKKNKTDEYVLKSISFRLGKGEKLGIVGRTGSGKSTLLKLLFRLYDLERDSFDGGEIRIDGINIDELSLPVLRTSMVYIAQNPTLISGSIRENLDVRGEFEDHDIWEALEMVGLKERMKNDRLETDVKETKFSAGEKQLISFARAILHKKRILILDEASSAVDPMTDEKMQMIVKKFFSDATIFAIAHRLETIMDYDKIMVLKSGRIVQFGIPKDLLGEPNSILLDMVEETGKERCALLKNMAGLYSEEVEGEAEAEIFS